MLIYKLRSENLTHLGGPMGTECTYTNWVRYYSSVQWAKEAAQEDYAKKVRLGQVPIKWSSIGPASYRSQDLGHVMYYISKVNVEK